MKLVNKSTNIYVFHMLYAGDTVENKTVVSLSLLVWGSINLFLPPVSVLSSELGED